MGRNRHHNSVRLWDKWREGRGMPEQRYTIGEAVSLLDVDRVTLARWLAVENMTPQNDPRDKRIRYLTREQILELARIHGKIIRDETSIGPRLTGMQREMLARIQHLEEVAADILIRLERIERTTHERYNRLQAQSEGRHMPPPTLSSSEYMPTPESPSTPSYVRETTQAYHGERLRPGEWRMLDPIPPGWLPPRKMAEEIGVPIRTFLHALRPRSGVEHDTERYGTLDYHEGRWQGSWPGTYASELLDPEQQEAARAWFATRGQ